MKLKIHYTCYLALIMSFLAGFFAVYLLALLILIFHECGHIIFLHKNKEDIEVTFLPFGGIIKYQKSTKINALKELKIASGGLLVNIILGILFYLLKWNILFKINILLFIFNAIPIFPLDGGRILALILSLIFPYRKSLFVTYGVSIAVILGIAIINLVVIHSLFVYLALAMLFIQNIKYLLNASKEYVLFTLDKYLNYSENKLKIRRALTLKNPLNRLFFYYNTDFYIDNYSISEYKLLKKQFQLDSKKKPQMTINVV